MNELTSGDTHVPPSPDAPVPSTGRVLPIRFTASGSEYFRIWIANLLLTLLTLGLYHPWAKVRKLRYFYGNTWVGDHAFDFHGDPRRMLRGTVLVGLMFLAYSTAGQFSPVAGVVALLIVAAVAPALFVASLRFRMANTSWRGLRFHFGGGMAGAYKALLPALVPGVLFLGFALTLPEAVESPERLASVQAVEDTDKAPSGATAANDETAEAGDATEAEEPADPEDLETVGGPVEEKPTRPATPPPPVWVQATLGFAVLGTLALIPLILWGIKRYQHGHYGLGEVRSRLQAGPGAFYLLFLKAFGVLLLATAVIAVAVVGIAAVLGVAALFGGDRGTNRDWVLTLVAFAVVGAAGYLALLVVSNTFMASRLQNLVWNATRSPELHFESDLKLMPLMGLTLKNWLLIALTLGLYWPFAAVASARMKLQAVSVVTRGSLDEFTARVGRGGAADASGDAAGDIFGLDVGL
ncbi:MAG: YjgN family protein [Rhizobacter sp.]